MQKAEIADWIKSQLILQGTEEFFLVSCFVFLFYFPSPANAWFAFQLKSNLQSYFISSLERSQGWKLFMDEDAEASAELPQSDKQERLSSFQGISTLYRDVSTQPFQTTVHHFGKAVLFCFKGKMRKKEKKITYAKYKKAFALTLLISE